MKEIRKRNAFSGFCIKRKTSDWKLLGSFFFVFREKIRR